VPRRLCAVLCFAALHTGLAEAFALGAEEELSVLTYNVHGLPFGVAAGDPAGRMPLIGAHMVAYDVVLAQEDFAFHERLRAAVAHPIVRRGNPSRMPWCPICSGAGLTLLARLHPDALLDHTAVPYDTCAGWIGGGSDCFATKGFQHARLQLPGGAVVDFLHTHLDAGRRAADRQARRRQIDTLRAFAARQVGPRALVVGGDLNLLATDPDDAAQLAELQTALGLTDARARPAEGGGFPTVDYLLYRSGSGATLELLEAGEDRAFTRGSEPLSDHPALFARFRVRPADPPRGGPE
jgi:endonuclease/exonuclease/phosphatase family metal-dependent hydrolase